MGDDAWKHIDINQLIQGLDIEGIIWRVTSGSTGLLVLDQWISKQNYNYNNYISNIGEATVHTLDRQHSWQLAIHIKYCISS